ncbi:MAG: HesA/MoeB/ThiF family protein [Gammaproteobacteria bacterium]
MNEQQLLRYSRQIALPQIDIAGQERLLASRVMIAGAGGLGQTAALYLAGAGVGKISIVDFDRAELSNLHRQIALSMDSIAENKAEATAKRLRQINPEIDVCAIPQTITSETSESLLKDYDLLLDGMDNFDSRFALARVAVKATTPCISAAVIRAEGQIALLGNDGKKPCYGCLYSPFQKTPESSEQSCAHSGVMGPVAGMVASMQANEALKFLISGDTNTLGQLWILDGWRNELRRLHLARDPQCTICGSSNHDC